MNQMPEPQEKDPAQVELDQLRIQKLSRKTSGVLPNKMVLAFHLNTKLGHCLGMLWGKIGPTRQEWENAAREFAINLPEAEATCGATGAVTDPWEPTREVFGGNARRFPTGTSLATLVERMGNAARIIRGDRGADLCHANLLEILEQCGAVPEGTAKQFYTSVGMQHTSAEICEEFALETAGGESLEAHLVETKAWSVDTANKMVEVPGYGGDTCRFPYREMAPGEIAVLQPENHHLTSITNLAERVRDAVRTQFGENTRVYEIYEIDPERPSEITGPTGGNACWEAPSEWAQAELQKWAAQGFPKI